MPKGVNLTEKTLHDIERMLDRGFSGDEVASILGIGKTTVYRVANGEHALQRKQDPVAVEDLVLSLERQIEDAKKAQNRGWANLGEFLREMNGQLNTIRLQGKETLEVLRDLQKELKG